MARLVLPFGAWVRSDPHLEFHGGTVPLVPMNEPGSREREVPLASGSGSPRSPGQVR